MIDAGGDAFVGHGAHQLRGIEVYKGRPIFYSLGDFAMMDGSLDIVPGEMYELYGVNRQDHTVPEILWARNGKWLNDDVNFESVVAVSQYSGGRLNEIRLYPLDLGVSLKGAGRGVPTLASGSEGGPHPRAPQSDLRPIRNEDQH